FKRCPRQAKARTRSSRQTPTNTDERGFARRRPSSVKNELNGSPDELLTPPLPLFGFQLRPPVIKLRDARLGFRKLVADLLQLAMIARNRWIVHHMLQLLNALLRFENILLDVIPLTLLVVGEPLARMRR